MHGGPIRERTRLRARLRWAELRFEGGIIEVRARGPTHAGRSCAIQVRADGVVTDVQTAANGPAALAEGSKAEDFTELAHREAFGGHHLLLKVQGKWWALGEPIASLSVQHACGGQLPRYGWSISPERVVTIVGIGGQIRRIRWSASIGIPGQLLPDSVVSMGRNTQYELGEA
jgi:hypothetical protein